jgi:hypothetical protein
MQASYAVNVQSAAVLREEISGVLSDGERIHAEKIG